MTAPAATGEPRTEAATPPRLRTAGDAALVIELGEAIDRTVNARVMALSTLLRAEGPPGLIEVVPTFRSVLLTYDPLRLRHRDLVAALTSLFAGDWAEHAVDSRLWRIPVCYDGELAPDLEDVGERTGLGAEGVVERHLAGTYFAYCLGAFPGLAYLGDTDPALTLPRRQNPRTKVPRGAVAITGQLTTVYPLETPGGWHLIGQAPVVLFEADRTPPAVLAPGDRVRFERIDRDRYNRLLSDALAGRWRLTPQIEPDPEADPGIAVSGGTA